MLENIQKKIILSLPFLDLLFAYCFMSIGSFSFTPAFIGVSLLLVVSVFCSIKKSKNITLLLVSLLVILIPCLGNADLGFDLNSTLLHLFYFILYFVILNVKRFKVSPKYLKAYVVVTTVLSAVGIIQFLLQFTSIGYLWFEIPNHMTPGFNHGNLLYLHGVPMFYRAHSIYAEPSMLSQYAALSILLGFYIWKKFKVFKKNRSFVISIIINAIAIVLSFGGTGVVLLAAGILYLYIKYMKRKKSAYLGFILFLLIVLFLAGSAVPALWNFFYSRLFEVFYHGTSGHVRFVLPYTCSFYTLFARPWGFGCGNTVYCVDIVYPDYPWQNKITDVNSTLGKIIIEFGIGGLILFVYYCVEIHRKSRNDFSRFVLFLVFISQFLGGHLLDSSNICLLSLFLIANGITERKIVVEVNGKETINKAFVIGRKIIIRKDKELS